MSRCCVAHLVRKRNGLEPFRRYLDSYRRHPAGVVHDHIMIFKGFGKDSLAEQMATINGLPYRAVLVDDTGFDIGSYLTAAERCQYDTYCFVNSYSRVQADNWLRYLCNALGERNVGMVGATSSAGSISSYARWQAGVPNPYDGFLFPDPSPASTPASGQKVDPARRVWRVVWRGYSKLRQRFSPPTPWAWTPEGLEQVAKEYEPFPAYHLRTNAFLVRREVLQSLPRLAFKAKEDAYRFESGRHSLTNLVLGLGLDVRVVGRDGRSYAREDWHHSNTFWQGDQENLLVADNQTDKYQAGNDQVRLFLARFAWGGLAAPAPAGR